MLNSYKDLPRDKQFAVLLRYSINEYFPMIEEQKDRISKTTLKPIIHGDLKVIKDIAVYVATNIRDYIKIHKIKINNFDDYKVLYWVGMYFYEKKYINDVEKIQEVMNKGLSDSNKIMQTDMFKKITKFSKNGADSFFKYYGKIKVSGTILCIYLILS
jgi:hypothetical protein